MYIEVVNALLSTLLEVRDYACIMEYATRSFQIDPSSCHAHYWLIVSLIKGRNKRMAREALSNAKVMLSEEDYRDMCLMMNKIEPGFAK